jgi:hypothetical protein
MVFHLHAHISLALFVKSDFLNQPTESTEMATRTRRPRTFWTEEMDAKLKESVILHGGKDWKRISDDLGVDRKSVRDRYLTLFQNPDRNPFSEQEDARILELVRTIGLRWVRIAKDLGSRTAKQCRGRYQKILRDKQTFTLGLLTDLAVEVVPPEDEESDWQTETW